MFRSEVSQIGRASTLLLLLAVSASASGCGGSQSRPKEPDARMENPQSSDRTVSLIARAVMYKPNSMHDDFVGGVSDSYDLAIYEVQAPASYSGIRLRVASKHVPDREPIHVEVGKSYKIEISSHLLETPEAYLSPDSLKITPE